jgi:alanine racemase
MRGALTEIAISRSSLIHNVKAFRRVVGPRVRLMAVVKSNAYGHGVGECASVFKVAGVDWFGVASLREALQLRLWIRRKPILILSYVDGSTPELRKAIQHEVRLPAYTLEQLHQYQRIAHQLKKSAIVHIKFDTGTSRIGFLPKELPRVLQELLRLPNINVEGVFSHFADVEAKQQEFSQLQQERFATLAKILERSLGKQLIKHIDCSAGVLVHTDTHFDMVRVGMSLYGVLTVADVRRVHTRFPRFTLRPALSLHTRVIQVKSVPRGVTIGYGRTFHVKQPTRIAVLPIGYWDGYDRKLSNTGYVLIHGKRAPIRGRVCMNLTMVEVTNLTEARVGSRVTLIGCEGASCITAETLAEQIGSIPYEVLTRLNPLIPRVLVT